MASLYELPSTEETEKSASQMKAEAKKHFDAIVKNGAMESTSSLRIGWHAYHLKKANLFGVLGYGDEDETREASGVGESTWYANLRLAEAFPGLDEEQFASMKQANAKKATDLPESKRLSREWVRMAGSMSMKEFKAKVDEEMNGKAVPSDTKEKSTVLKMDMPASRKKVIEEKLAVYAEKVGLNPKDPGKALEVMIVEQESGPGLIAAITNAIQRIKIIREMAHSALSAEEILERTNQQLDEMVLEFQAALTGVQNLDQEEE